MIVKITSRSEEELEEFDYRDEIKIFVDDTQKFSVADDEPEDSNLSRAFSDCYGIPELMRLAYEAGKRGEEFEII